MKEHVDEIMAFAKVERIPHTGQYIAEIEGEELLLWAMAYSRSRAVHRLRKIVEKWLARDGEGEP